MVLRIEREEVWFTVQTLQNVLVIDQGAWDAVNILNDGPNKPLEEEKEEWEKELGPKKLLIVDEIKWWTEDTGPKDYTVTDGRV